MNNGLNLKTNTKQCEAHPMQQVKDVKFTFLT